MPTDPFLQQLQQNVDASAGPALVGQDPGFTAQDETQFQDWYRGYANRAGLDPNPDDPRHHYDYRAWYKAMRADPEKWSPSVDPQTSELHGPSAFKTDDHPNRFIEVDGKKFDTKYDRFMPDGVDPEKLKDPFLSQLANNAAEIPNASEYARSMAREWDDLSPTEVSLNRYRERMAGLKRFFRPYSTDAEGNPDLARTLTDLFTPFASSAVKASAGTNEIVKNVAEVVASLTDTNVPEWIDRLNAPIEEGGRYNELASYQPQDLAARVASIIGDASFIVPQFALAGEGALQAAGGLVKAAEGLGLIEKGLPGTLNAIERAYPFTQNVIKASGPAVLGALQHIGEQPVDIVKGAAEYFMLDMTLGATAKMPVAERVLANSGFFAAQAKAEGGDNDEVLASALAGAMLGFGTGERGDPSLSIVGRLKDGMKKQAWFSALRKAGVIEPSDPIEVLIRTEGAQEYMKQMYPSMYRRFRSMLATEYKDRPVATNTDVVQDVNNRLDNMLQLNPVEQTWAIQDKVLKLVNTLDKVGRLEPNQKVAMVDKFVENLYSNAEVIKQLSTSKAGRANLAKQQDQEALRKASTDRIDNSYKAQQEAAEKARKFSLQRVVDSVRDNLFDYSGTLKRTLRSDYGQYAEEAIRNMELVAGAHPAANEYWKEWRDPVFGGLSKDQMKRLGQLIFSSNAVQVGERKPGHKFLGGKSLDHRFWVESKAREWNDFNELWVRKEKYNQALQQQLQLLRAAKIISKEQYDTLSKFDQYSPIRFIQELDPLAYAGTYGGRKLSVADSGVYFLEKGKLAGRLETDPAELLMQTIVRTQGRIFKNEANKSLYRLASMKEFKDIDLLRVADKTKSDKWLRDKMGRVVNVKTPEGYERIGAFIDGKQELVFMRRDIAEEWIQSSPQLSATIARIGRVMSGGVILRPLATGINSEFIVTNMPRDFVHIWLTTNEYSSFLPTYVGQMARDMASTAIDAFLRRGSYKDAVKEGMGMEFLTHQGVDILKGRVPWTQVEETKLSRSARGAGRQGERLRAALGYLNETSEVWLRLALRQRALRNGKSRTEASHIARTYLDFAQGGKFSKTADNFIPYLNASIQAFRGVVNQAGRRPGRVSWQATQLLGLFGGLALWNEMYNPEAIDGIDSYTKLNNFVLTTPYFYIDPLTGNKRWLTLTMRIDNTVAPLKFIADTAVQRLYRGKLPDEAIVNHIGDVVDTFFPFAPASGIPVPTIAAISSYVSNYDFWRDRSIWTGGDVKSQDEYTGLGEGSRPTPQFWIDLGKATGVSPMRLQTAVNQVVPRNLYTDLSGALFASMAYGENQTDSQYYKSVELPIEVIQGSPFIRKLMRFSHPYVRDIEAIDTTVREVNSEMLQSRREVDSLYAKMRTGGASAQDIRDYVRTLPARDQTRLMQRVDAHIQIDRLFDAYQGKLPAVTAHQWWMKLHSAPATARARLFYERWRGADGDERRKLADIASRLNFGKDNNGAFWTEFRKLQRDEGSGD